MAGYMMRGQAKFWWRSTQTILAEDPSEITWDAFLVAFREQYVPHAAQKRMQKEFLDLRQGSSTVDEYENRFTTLMRYDLETVKDPERRIERFLARLRSEIRDKLLGSEYRRFQI